MIAFQSPAKHWQNAISMENYLIKSCYFKGGEPAIAITSLTYIGVIYTVRDQEACLSRAN